MATWTTEEIQEAVQKVGEKSAKDQKFRKLLMEKPKEAIKQVANKEMPEGFTLKLIEADPAVDMTFVLPPLQTDELSDRELDQVAGGRGRDCPNLSTCQFDNPTTTTTYQPTITCTA